MLYFYVVTVIGAMDRTDLELAALNEEDGMIGRVAGEVL